MNDIEFIPLSFKAPRDGAPDFVKNRISFKREEMLAYCQASDDEWINGDVKESKGGKLYVQRDNWKPDRGEGGARAEKPASVGGGGSSRDVVFEDDSIPFVTNQGMF